MRINYNPLVGKTFEYEIDRKEFNRLMNIKKTVDRYDKNGVKKVKIHRDMDNNAITKFGRHKAERIKSEFMQGSFVLVMLATPAQVADDFATDHYIKQAEILIEENDAVRIYRDSLNDGYTNARFCDDTVMLIAVKSGEDKRYLKIEGEPTGFGSWKLDDSVPEEVKEHFCSIIKKYQADAMKKFNMHEDKVFVVIQLEDV